MPQAPTGTFNLPMKDASRVESTCLQNADQNAAGVWKCASDTEMQFTVRQRDVGDTLVSLVSYRDRNSKFPYGALPPDVIPESPVRYMLDMDADDYGPALFFQNAYNKTVIVPVGALNATVARRSADEILAEAHRLSLRDDKPKPGEVAWFCYWEQTLFEGFIYLRRDVGNAGSPTTSAASASITPNSGNQQGNYPPAARRHRRGNKSTSEVYPKLVKIEERRTPRSPQPYCKQKKILDDWSAVDVENSPIIKLQEKVFMPKQRVNYATKQMEDGNNSNGGGFGSKGGGGGANGRRSHGSKHAHEKRGGDDQCHCEWMGT